MKSIYEVMSGMTHSGLDFGSSRGIDPNREIKNIYQLGSSTSSTDPDGYIYKFCHKLRADQQEIIKALQSGKDVFVNMGAGGGKTMPILCYWLNNILKLNTFLKRDLNIHERFEMSHIMGKIFYNSKDLPKVLFLVPTKTLAIQTEQEFQQVFNILLLQYFIKSTNVDQLHQINDVNEINNILENLNIVGDGAIRSAVNQYKNILNTYVRQNNTNIIPLQNETPLRHSNPSQFDLEFIDHTNMFHKKLSHLIEQNIQRVSQRLCVKKTGEDSGAGIEDSIVAVAIYQSAPSVLKRIKDVKLIICDEAHKIQSSSEQITDSESKSIANSFYVLMNSVKNMKTQIIMLTGTIHPESAENLTVYLKKCFGRNFIIKTLPSKNPSIINIITSDELLFKDKQAKIILNLISKRDYGNLFILYSGKGIENLSESVLKLTGKYSPPSDESLVYRGPRRSLRKPIVDKNMFNKPVTSRDAAKIQHPLLRQCVEHGFGFVHSSRNTTFGPVTNEDKNLIQHLFMQKKIAVIIATDAIGVGLNISAKSMYIPINEKFSSHTMQNEEVAIRDVTQIINRVGRGVFSLGYIFTPKKYASQIINAVNSTENSFVKVEAIKKWSLCNAPTFAKIYYRISQLTQKPDQ